MLSCVLTFCETPTAPQRWNKLDLTITDGHPGDLPRCDSGRGTIAGLANNRGESVALGAHQIHLANGDEQVRVWGRLKNYNTLSMTKNA